MVVYSDLHRALWGVTPYMSHRHFRLFIAFRRVLGYLFTALSSLAFYDRLLRSIFRDGALLLMCALTQLPAARNAIPAFYGALYTSGSSRLELLYRIPYTSQPYSVILFCLPVFVFTSLTVCCCSVRVDTSIRHTLRMFNSPSFCAFCYFVQFAHYAFKCLFLGKCGDFSVF